MERYIAQGIANDIADGQHVVLIPSPIWSAPSILYQISEYTDESYTSVNHAAFTITDSSGGRVSIIHNTENLQGLQIDVLVAPDKLDPEEFRFFLKTGTELIRY